MSSDERLNGHDEPVLCLEEITEVAAQDERQNFLDVAAIAAMQGMLVGQEVLCAPELASDAWDVAYELWRVREARRNAEATQ